MVILVRNMAKSNSKVLLCLNNLHRRGTRKIKINNFI